MRIKTSKLLHIIIVLTTALTTCYDNVHFYRATNLFFGPRLEKPCLTSIDITLGGGHTKKGKNKNKCTVPLGDIYGTHNMQVLGVNVPSKDPNNQLDMILDDLAALPMRENFATFSIDNRFGITESNLTFTQNSCNGFFGQIHLPIRKLTIKLVQH